MLADEDLMKVQKTCAELTHPVTLLVNKGLTEDGFEQNLFNVARQISGVSANLINLEEGLESVFAGKPSLTLSAGENRNIHYFASPEGPELGPFLDAVSWLGKGSPLPESDVQDSVIEMKAPAHILVLMSEACPHCPVVVRSALSLAVRQPRVTVSVVEALQFSDLAERYKVKATPTTVINDGMTIVGLVSGEDLARHLLQAQEPDSLTQILESMINSGRAEDAAELMCRRKQPTAVLPLYKAPEFSTRMGVLVTLEEALDKDPRVLDPIVDDLNELLSSDDVGLRGDTAELLGKIGSPRAIPALQKVAQDPDEDVREAVQEALELLEK